VRTRAGTARIDAVVFDLDGVLIDSERAWNTAREAVVRERGGRWRPEATRQMMGMSSPEWSRYMREQLAVELSPAQITAQVVRRMEDLYRADPPLIDGAREAVAALGRRWPLAVASSANMRLIELVLELTRLHREFSAIVSAEEVAEGKPAPDVYLEATRRLGARPGRCVAVEDSGNGLRAAAAAGLMLVAIPNRDFEPAAHELALANATIRSLRDLDAELLERIATGRT
jgi:HAD superfamily hydrolase (TIGR01509 family)